jgi:CRISPR/Cas system-associated exonuclease Cas4 (RecB family)
LAFLEKSFVTKYMVSFLDKVRQHISSTFPDLEVLTVIVPSRRSMRALKQEFVKADVEKLPVIYPIDDFITHTAKQKFKKADQIELLLILQNIAHKILEKKQGSDNLLSWLPTLLKDFSVIDQYLVDAKKIFSNLADIQRIKSWNLTEYRQAQTQEKLRYYFEFWDKLFLLYTEFKKQLEEQNKAYTGLMYRFVAENVQELLLENTSTQHYIFVGFNAFNKSEESIIEQLRLKDKVTLLWDTDSFYMKHKGENPAAKFLKKYQKQWKDKNNRWLWEENLLSETSKQIDVIASGNFTLQAHIAEQLLKTWDKEKRTVIILPEESLLLSLLHSIDEEEHYKGYNITMGLNLQSSTLFNLIMILFEMQQTKKVDKWLKVHENGEQEEKNSIKYHYRQIFKVLNHPFIRKYEQLLIKEHNLEVTDSFIREAVQYIVRYNKIHMSSSEMRRLPNTLLKQEQDEQKRARIEPLYTELEELLALLFNYWDINLVSSIAKKIQKLMECFEKVFVKNTDDLERFYLKKFKRLFRKLRGLLAKKEYSLDFRTFRNFLMQLVREERIPFESNRDSKLQIMGFLETRTLDFEQVIILAANEGTFPQSKKTQSLIPFDVAKNFGLPTYEEQEAMQSYHFYRLLQRAEKVALVYCSSKTQAGGGSNEVSRYVLQLEHDLAKLNPSLKIKRLTAQFETATQTNQEDLKFAKTPEVIELIKQRLENNISPSALDSFVQCSLKFYFNYLGGIKEADEVEEEVGADTFGIVIHAVLEDIFGETNDEGLITRDILKKQLSTIKKRVKQKFQEKASFTKDAMVGINLIAQEVASHLIRKFIEQQIRELEDNSLGTKDFEILSLENKEDMLKVLPAEFTYRDNQQTLQVRLRGIVDRVDKFSQVLRIIDYKTGTVNPDDLKMNEEKFLKIAESKDLSKARQLWLYRYLLLKNLENNPQWEKFKNHPIEAGIYSMRKLDKGLITLQIDKPKDTGHKGLPLDDKQWFLQKTEQWLQQIIRKMLDIEQDFQKTEDIKTCEYCQFKNICSRG